MSQESLDFGPVWTVKDSAREVYRLLNLAEKAIGGVGVAAGACSAAEMAINRSDLRRALDREDGRRVGVEHAMVIAAMCMRSNSSLAIDICNSIVGPCLVAVAPPPPRLSDAELRAAYESGELQWRTGR